MSPRPIVRALVALLVAWVGSAAAAPALAAAPAVAERIFVGGPVITMDDDRRVVEALAVADGRILAVGPRDAVMAHAGEGTRVTDLEGKALLPGFVDAHGHLKNAGFQALVADLLPPPDAEVDSIADLQRVLRAWGETPASQATGWILGFGYDDSQLAEQRHPTRDDLDAVSTEKPIFLIHQSGHLYAANSRLLALAGITAETPDPPGGVIRRRAGSREPDGVLEETAGFAVLGVMPAFGPDGGRRMIEAGIAAYTRYGYTTAQEGRAMPADLDAYVAAAEQGALAIDVVAYADYATARDRVEGSPWLGRDYRHGFRIGGVKLNLDGSPQGKTAWLTKPYFVPPPGRGADYAGYPTLEEAQALAAFDDAYAHDWQVLAHANGDAAIDQLIRGIRAAAAKHGAGDRRPVGIHSQTIREDQIDAYRELGIVPSLFTMHTFYWGDWHRDSVLGPERAARISPARSVIDRGMRWTNHHDAPVARPDSMRVLSSAVTRVTRSGRVLGPEQRVTVMEALAAMTRDAAWQHFEEDRKGTLEPGKLADLVVLSEDPLSVPPARLSGLEVVETLKQGRTVYPLDAAP